jgi:hypothetical protein
MKESNTGGAMRALITLTAGLFVAPPINAAAIDVWVKDDSLVVLIENDADEPIEIGSHLGISDPAFGPCLVADVRTLDGQICPVRVKVAYARKSDRIALWPGEIVGTRISNEEIERYYGLEKGTYSIQVLYCDVGRQIQVLSERKTISIHRGEKAEPGATDNPGDAQ